MTIAAIPQIPKRNTQPSKLASLQHDNIHEQLRATINLLIDEINTLSGGGGTVPTGTVLSFSGATLPSGGYLWANGQAVSRTTYATLFTAIGVVYGSGDGATTFNVPNMVGRVISGTNPMGGVTVGGLTARALGATFGAETNSYTPTGTVSQASIGSITATCGAINTSSLLIQASALQSLVDGISATSTPTLIVPSASLQTLIDGLAATSTTVNASGMTCTVTPANGAVSGTGTAAISGAACSDVTATGEVSAMNCDATLVVDISTIAAGLTTNVTIASAVLGGTTLPAPTITVNKPSATDISVTGTVATSINPGTAVNISVSGSVPTPVASTKASCIFVS